MYAPNHLHHSHAHYADSDHNDRSFMERKLERDVFLYPTMKGRIPAKASQQSSTSMSERMGHASHDPYNSQCPILPPPPLPRTPPSRMPIIMAPPRRRLLLSPPAVHRVTSSPPPMPDLRYERIGDPALSIFKLSLPPKLVDRLDGIIALSEEYAESLRSGWKTELYSLTKQDVALREIPGMGPRMRPIFDYITQAIQVLFGGTVMVDKNQPHILKYSMDSGHTGVQLHHDRCDVTANLVLSKSDEYEGGGTFIPDANNRVIRLEQGEVLLHPGSLVHGGMDIRKGTRFLMVIFAHLK